VDEVQSVIRELTKTGKTMMIVTHEMKFARAICNRVFYMDGGGIYEDGTPEQVFDNPKRENTRRFVRRLKVLELNIESRGYDFLGMAAEIRQYCDKNQISPKLFNRIRFVFEELVQQIILPVYEQPFIRVNAEYSPGDGACQIDVRYKGDRFDIHDTANDLSLAVLKGTVKEMTYDYHEEEAEPNHIKIGISL
jgi:polar amino acid transport system ATP-binding protein